jgi:hypothetical protein
MNCEMMKHDDFPPTRNALPTILDSEETDNFDHVLSIYYLIEKDDVFEKTLQLGKMFLT